MSVSKNCLLLLWLLCVVPAADVDGAPPGVERWLGQQQWERDTAGPVISLGLQGEFDAAHLFAPLVAFEKDRYWLWYSGSQGTVAKRVFDLGLATSTDGKHFQKHSPNPVFSFKNAKSSILTATLLRNADGSVLRENGRLRLWFSATHFAGGTGLHTLHESRSKNGIDWSAPSSALLKGVYAPTIVKDKGQYRLWYTDVSVNPWVFRHATSEDGRSWKVTKQPVLKVDQSWEKGRLFYPTVLRVDGIWLMWYGSYWSKYPNKTALGFAASTDGINWHKSPNNPVFRPDPNRPWESHYTTSQSVMRFQDGSWRIWYASRKKPPFVNKYFAIGTARWAGPNSER